MTRLTAKALDVRLGDRAVLGGVALELGPGQLVGLIGPNGAGKTTLLRALAGLIRPTSGRVMLDDADLGGLAARERARLVGYLAQAGAVHWPLTVERLVALGRLPWGDEKGEAIARAMADCGVAALAARPMPELSGGERALALLARALAGEPALLLADEPVAGLDPAHRLQVMALLRDRARGGQGVLVVLHDLGLAARFCDRLVLLDDGRVVAAGPPGEVLRPERLAAVYDVEVLVQSHDGEPLVTPWRRV